MEKFSIILLLVGFVPKAMLTGKFNWKNVHLKPAREGSTPTPYAKIPHLPGDNILVREEDTERETEKQGSYYP